MDDVLDFLKGKKTYFFAAGGAVVVGLYLAGVLSREMTDTVLALFGFGGLAALRAGVASSES